MTDAERERIIDRRVSRRLATDPEYRNAENAEAQALREEELVDIVERELDAELEEQRIGERAGFRTL